MRLARHGDDARRRGRLDAVEQQLRKQEVPQVIDAEGKLKTRLGEATPACETRVVDQEIQRQATCKEGLRAIAHRRKIAQIERQQLGFAAIRQGVDFVQHGLRTLG